MDALFEQINTATGVLGKRYGRDEHGALLLLLDWSRDTGLSVFTLAEWITKDARATAVSIPGPRHPASS